ncbi:MAG: argininosuccinate lyase [Anaerolineales bacterium]|nr:argininosuccinate lyase [Anaerolineales bacterium]MDW8227964.1 argininosuccinate lyase [Anaerolineales bacterium]
MLWGGRFSESMHPLAWRLNESLSIDRRLALQDIRGSLAWVKALQNVGLLSAQEAETLQKGLEQIKREFAEGRFVFHESDEDIHTAVERRLGELVGEVAGKLHTGRSRNDQVATDFRLWMLETLPQLDAMLRALQQVLLKRAEEHIQTIMPGYTHLQRAQPITLAHWFLSHFWPLQRDRQRLRDFHPRLAILPLGSGALAGCAFPVNRHALASELGFLEPAPNSMDAVSDRDFVIEYLSSAALIGLHLSKLAEQIILFTTTEFGFFELSDAFTTGSSLMPQKKNPDIFELTRAKAAYLNSLLSGALGLLKALPSTYDKDLQEDKRYVFEAADTLFLLLPTLTAALQEMRIHPERMKVDSSMLATDLADEFVRRGMPFREAHRRIGQIVRKAVEAGLPLDQLPSEAWTDFGESLSEVLSDPIRAVERRNVWGGTAPEAVCAQLKLARTVLEALENAHTHSPLSFPS